MLKNKASTLTSTIQWLTIFDKFNIFIVFSFFVIALLLPVAYINPLTNDAQTQTLRIISLEYWKTSIIIVILLIINAWMSINNNFKSRFLRYTWIWNDIYARFFQKWVVFIILIFFGELVLYLRNTLTQTINIARGYYILGWIIIVGLIIDFMFLQRNYKVNKAHNNSQATMLHEENDTNKQHQSFKNLFEE